MAKTEYTTEEAATALGVSSSRVRQLIVAGQIKTKLFGRVHVITSEALAEAKRRKTTRGPAPAKKGNKK
jgi:excisionase family DNA binding protein